MAIVRTREVAIADVWANDDDGVTLEVRGKRAHLSIDEAEEHAFAILTAATDQRQTIQARRSPEPDLTESAI